MRHEDAFLGLFFPSLLLCAAIAALLWFFIDMAMRKTSMWLVFWHPPLARLALFFVVFGLVSALYPDF